MVRDPPSKYQVKHDGGKHLALASLCILAHMYTCTRAPISTCAHTSTYIHHTTSTHTPPLLSPHHLLHHHHHHPIRKSNKTKSFLPTPFPLRTWSCHKTLQFCICLACLPHRLESICTAEAGSTLQPTLPTLLAKGRTKYNLFSVI